VRRAPATLATVAALATLVLGGASCAWLDPEVGALRPADTADAAGDADAPAASPVSFKRDIRPLMDRASTDATGHGCRACHYSTQPSHLGLDATGLDLATLGALRRGGVTSGSHLVVAGDPASSALVQKLEGTYATGARMPRDGPAYWSPEDIAKVKRWIAEGALGADDE
jgi:hypothetical protein